jgi:hypothetical protein
MISKSAEEALDRYEGVQAGMYAKAQLSVRMMDGRGISALVYVATDSVPGRPRPGYLEPIIETALSRRFSWAYLEELRTWLKTAD